MMPICEGIGCEKTAVFLGPNENPAYCEEHLDKLVVRIGEWVSRNKPAEKPNANFEIKNSEIEHILNDIGTKIGYKLPAGWGFTLAIASYGEKGSTFYISNVERSGSIDMLKELIVKLQEHKEVKGDAS